MPTNLTERDFSRHLNSTFKLNFQDQTLELKLVEVKAYMPGKNEQAGMERFSVFFDGPGTTGLPQSVYSLTHEEMGQFDIFLVPIAGDEKKFRYEAVFNHFSK